MQFDDLKNGIKGIAIDDLREESQDYFEAVIMKEELEKIVNRLEKFLGLPARPSKAKLSSQIEGAIKEYGGIGPGQTLYFSKLDNRNVFAMLWPWSDGNHITLKIIQQ